MAWTEVISTVAAAVAAIFAAISIYQVNRARKKERESQRPYFISQERPQRVPSADKPEGTFDLSITFKNSGVRPAADVVYRALIISKKLEGEPIHKGDLLSSSIETPGGGDLLYLAAGIEFPPNTESAYLVFFIKYRDRILGKTFTQRFYFTWIQPVQTGFGPIGFHGKLPDEERQKLDKYCERYLKDFE